jgi:polyisoprenoid-binding protein YceI
VTRLRIVPERSRVFIDASSSVHPIHSETSSLEGWFQTEPEPGGHLELAVGDLGSGNPLIDREMKRRIDARRHPTIAGELIEMKATADGRFAARGTITFRGVTREVEGKLHVSPEDEGSVRITGERVFDVREFGFEPPKILMLKVHPEVTVRIDVVGEREESLSDT